MSCTYMAKAGILQKETVWAKKETVWANAEKMLLKAWFLYQKSKAGWRLQPLESLCMFTQLKMLAWDNEDAQLQCDRYPAAYAHARGSQPG